MKLLIDNIEVLVDFNYENSFRPLRKGEKCEYFGSRKGSKSIVVTTCTITFPSEIILAESVKCDSANHNREFARKYSLQKTINSLSKELRTKIWKAYFDYLVKDKVEYLAIDGFGFQNINGIITIDTRDKEIVLTSEQRNLLIKLLK